MRPRGMALVIRVVLLRLGENEQKKTHLTPEELDRYMRLEDNT